MFKISDSEFRWQRFFAFESKAKIKVTGEFFLRSPSPLSPPFKGGEVKINVFGKN